MNQGEFDSFGGILEAVADLYGKTIKPNQTAMYFRALSDYPLSAVQAAFDAHAKDPERGRFMPLPADLLGQIERIIAANDGRPTPEEAWATALEAVDEANTVVWTIETAAAWWQVAFPLMAVGDKFNAGRGFIDKYQKLVADARKRGEPVRWDVSAGTDKDLRQQKIEQAYRAKRIGRETAVLHLPRHSGDVGHVVKGLLPHLGAPKAIESDRITELHRNSRRFSDLLAAQPAREPDNRPTVAQNLRIFNAAEEAGVFRSVSDMDSWMHRATSREDLSELQAMILAKESRRA